MLIVLTGLGTLFGVSMLGMVFRLTRSLEASAKEQRQANLAIDLQRRHAASERLRGMGHTWHPGHASHGHPGGNASIPGGCE